MQNRYTTTARILHWLSAAVILYATVAGFCAASMSPDSALRGLITSLNISLTTTFLPVFLFRMWYAAVSRKPRRLAVSRGRRLAARAVHLLLYGCTATILISGVAMMDHSISLWGQLTYANPVVDPVWNERFYAVHRWSCVVLTGLLVLHIGAVIQHQRQGRKVLERMGWARRSHAPAVVPCPDCP